MKKIFSLPLLCLFLSACVHQHHPHYDTVPAHWNLEKRVYEENNKSVPYNISLAYPEVQSAPRNRALVKHLNQKVQEFNKLNMDSFKYLASRRDNEYQDYPPEMTHNNLNIAYQSNFMGPPNAQRMMSLRFRVETIFVGKTEPDYRFYVLNYDLKEGKPLLLQDLFKPNSDYLNVIANYCTQQLSRQLNIGMPWLPDDTDGTKAIPENFQVWMAEKDGLLITFQKEQLEPYTAKSHTVLVPYDILVPEMRADSPLLPYAYRARVVEGLGDEDNSEIVRRSS